MGLILPVMPGWVFIIPGLVILAEHSPRIRRLLDWARRPSSKMRGRPRAERDPLRRHLRQWKIGLIQVSRASSMLTRISVHGARQHNLKNIDVEIPRNTFTVITGLSGSGKSSLAFDTIYAEGQRRYVETLSPYARQFLDQMERPDVDSIDGLSPAISIEQKTTSRSPRSTVGTVTEIYDYLRLLYSSIGVPHCPECGIEIARQSTEQILQQVHRAQQTSGSWSWRRSCAAARASTRRNSRSCAQQGFVRARIDGELRSLDEEIALDKRKNHTIEVVVDRLVVKPGIEKRLEASIQTATKLADGLVIVVGRERRRAAVFAEAGLSGLRAQRSATGAALVLVQQPIRRVRSVHGLGSTWSFDPAKVITDPSKPLLDGALGVGASATSMLEQISQAGARLGLDLTVPFEQLPKKTQNTAAERRHRIPGHPEHP